MARAHTDIAEMVKRLHHEAEEAEQDGLYATSAAFDEAADLLESEHARAEALQSGFADGIEAAAKAVETAGCLMYSEEIISVQAAIRALAPQSTIHRHRATSSEPSLLGPTDPPRSEAATRKDAEAVAPIHDVPVVGYWVNDPLAGGPTLETIPTRGVECEPLVRQSDHVAAIEKLAREQERTTAVRDVIAERRRQVEAEGWSPEHDDKHRSGQMALAAAAYAMGKAKLVQIHTRPGHKPITSSFQIFPWSDEWWKPTGRRRDLVKAGALILAEIERLDRAEERANG